MDDALLDLISLSPSGELGENNSPFREFQRQRKIRTLPLESMAHCGGDVWWIGGWLGGEVVYVLMAAAALLFACMW